MDQGPRLTRAQIAYAVVLVLFFCCLVAWIIGRAATPAGSPFDWGTAASAATATGTILLAFATGLLAYTTSRDVSATWESVRLTREDQAARNRPVVMLQKVGADATKAGGETMWKGNLQLDLVNIGHGPALRLQVSIRLKSDAPDSIKFARDSWFKPALLVRDEASPKLDFTVIDDDGAYAKLNEAPLDVLEIMGGYQDLGFTTRLPIVDGASGEEFPLSALT